MIKELEVRGKPGNVCAIYNKDPDYGYRPTKGLAWGRFDEDGVFIATIDSGEHDEVVIGEYDPQVSKWFEKCWHLNTA